MFSAFAILKICLSLALAADKCKKRPKTDEKTMKKTIKKTMKKRWTNDEKTMKKRWTNEHVVTIVYGSFSNFYLFRIKML